MLFTNKQCCGGKSVFQVTAEKLNTETEGFEPLSSILRIKAQLIKKKCVVLCTKLQKLCCCMTPRSMRTRLVKKKQMTCLL